MAPKFDRTEHQGFYPQARVKGYLVNEVVAFLVLTTNHNTFAQIKVENYANSY